MCNCLTVVCPSDCFRCLALALAVALALALLLPPPCSIDCRLFKYLKRLCVAAGAGNWEQVLRLLLANAIPIAIAVANFRFGSDVSRSNCRSHVVFSCSSCAPLAARTLLPTYTWRKDPELF